MPHSTTDGAQSTPPIEAPRALYPGPTAADLDRIPAELKPRRQWVLWRGADRLDPQTGERKLNKIPIDPQTLCNADTTDPVTWGTFEQCVNTLPVALEGWEHEDSTAYRGGGIGFVFTSADPYAGVDLDHCRTPETGEIAGWAQPYIDALASYTEVTPSGSGVHILVQGAVPARGRRKGTVEMYDYARFFTMTGWHLPGTSSVIEARQDALTAFHTAIFRPQQSTQQQGQSPQAASTPLLDDAVLLDTARTAKNGVKFTALWSGDTTGYGSQSEADLALCVMLVFWTQDPAQLDRIFRQSGLRRDKWDEKRGAQTYGERTVAEALARQTEHYRPIKNVQQRRNGSPPEPAAAAESKPVIKVSTSMTAVVDDAQQAILAFPGGPHLFQRARRLALIARGIPPPQWLRRTREAPVIVPAEPAYLRELAAQAADWQKYDKRGKRWEPALPPPWVIETLCARPSWPFLPLEGIVCAPTLRPDGTVLAKAGYDPATGLYLDLIGTAYPPIQEGPTLDDARSAIGTLQQVFMDFPFAAAGHFSAALAAVLSLMARYAIQGNVPLFAVRSTTRASGKGLLIDAISTIATGRTAPRWAQTQDEEEERKRIFTLALAGDALLHIDNVVHPLGSAPLDLALTAPTFSDRLLGTNASKEAPMHAVFFASGNNMAFHGDTARRVTPINLDPKMERPEERDGFAHSPLLPWIRENRPTLVVAALTILKAYFTAGCPAQGIQPLGSFEEWSTLVRQGLIWAGEADPCEGRKDIEAESDPQYEALGTLLDCWDACYPNQRDGVTLKRVVQDIGIYAGTPVNPANTWDELRDALGAYDARYEGKSLNLKTVGFAFRTIQGRVIGNKRLVNAGTDHRSVKWCLKTL